MNRHGSCKAFALAGWLAAVASPLSASPIERVIDTAGRIGAVGIAYGDHTINAALSTSVEADSFTFAGAAGDQMRVLVRTFSGGLDASLVLRGPDGAVLRTAACDGGGGFLCSVSIDETLAAGGTYTVNVLDSGANEAGAYQLHLDRYPPVDNWVGVQYATPVDESLGHTTDMDFFGFNGVAGTIVQVGVRSFAGGLDPRLEIWDPLGARISNTACDGGGGFLCSNVVSIAPTVTGIYKLGILDSGVDEGGAYQLQVSCLFGNNCPLATDPAPNPIPIPEPGSWALLLAGLGVLRLVARWR